MAQAFPSEVYALAPRGYQGFWTWNFKPEAPRSSSLPRPPNYPLLDPNTQTLNPKPSLFPAVLGERSERDLFCEVSHRPRTKNLAWLVRVVRA